MKQNIDKHHIQIYTIMTAEPKVNITRHVLLKKISHEVRKCEIEIKAGKINFHPLML